MKNIYNRNKQFCFAVIIYFKNIKNNDLQIRIKGSIKYFYTNQHKMCNNKTDFFR